MKNGWVCVVGLALCLAPIAQGAGQGANPRPPNVVLIYADDLGYGDVGCYGATRVKTPNIDRLASEGLRFTDAHSPSATCTPSRYALLTGEYAWRKRGTGILPGDAALIIEPGRATLPSVLKSAGYTTGAVGKWHLGLGSGGLDWNGEIKPGPLEIGFDYAFLIPATGDRTPCVYVENHRVVGLEPTDPLLVRYGQKVGDDPTGKEHPELLKMKLSQGHADTIVNGISRIGFMSGGKAARWTDEDIADAITRKATDFIRQNRDKPFFLYFATHDIHVPRVPNARFAGKSGCGVRGDVIQEFDWSVGQVADTLKQLGLDDNTLLIVTSDNGPVVDDGYADGAVRDLNGHKPAGEFRGGKYSNYEAGTRIPMVVHWPGRVKPGVSDALVCQIDFLASFAALAGQALPTKAGPDSFNTLPALLGESKAGREYLVEHAGGPAPPAQTIRKGPWKLVPIPRPNNRADQIGAAGRQGGGGPELYNLADDPAESHNVAAQHPEVVKEMTELLQQVRRRGSSRPDFK